MVQILIMVIRILLLKKYIYLLRNMLIRISTRICSKSIKLKYSGGYFAITNNYYNSYYGSLRSNLNNLV